MLVERLPSSSLDFIGDVHGELSALENLLGKLGYTENGSHPEGRCLVFLGDLTDRGPDSVGVLRLVQSFVELGYAQCILGNHELNILLGKSREGNEWFYGHQQVTEDGEVVPQSLASANDREWILAWLKSLPLILERKDVRAVHACWNLEAVDVLRKSSKGALQEFEQGRVRAFNEILMRGFCPDSYEADVVRQNKNPVTVTTSGEESLAAESFIAGGRVRHVKRVPWWEEYSDSEDVVFGHYWRSLDPEAKVFNTGPYLFEGRAPCAPMGPLLNAWCIDYSIGYSYLERMNEASSVAALAALRFPERTLVFAT